MSVVGTYSKEDAERFSELFACFVLTAEDNVGGMRDILGELFGELGFTDEKRGQVFTPQNVCDMTAKMLIGDHAADIECRGYITVREPCSGAGAMVLGAANAMRDAGYDFQCQMFVHATDIDINCVYMTYLQLAVNGIPAVVTHGNALTDEVWSEWYTPVYVWAGWRERFNAERVSSAMLDVLRNGLPTVSAPIARSARTSGTVTDYEETAGGQLAMF
jgi:type I restriction-modification system DNA methylase subunit